MSFKDRLKKITPMIALGATLVTPALHAEEKAPENASHETIVSEAKSDWTWKNVSHKEAYKNLPEIYKSFAGKSFLERLEIKEEWEQRDFKTRDEALKKILKRNPSATVRDLYPQSSRGDQPLSDLRMAEGNLETQILKEKLEGKLSAEQAQIAEDLVNLGRPLETVDTRLPYNEQLRSCGFETLAKVAEGARESSLSPRDHSMLIAEMQTAEKLISLEQNEESHRDLRIRLEKENAEDYENSKGMFDWLFRTKTRLLSDEEMKANPMKWETINGKEILVPTKNTISYSIYDEVTRKVGQKIANEEEQNKVLQQEKLKRIASRD